MKLKCLCGSVIPDVTDFQENKAHFVPDETWESMCDEIEAGESPWNLSIKYQRVMFQCYECARLYVQNQNGEFFSFKPDENVSFGILKGT